MEKKFINVNEAVELLENIGLPIGKSVIYRKIAERSIPFMRYGEKKIIFIADELKTWAENQLKREVQYEDNNF